VNVGRLELLWSVFIIIWLALNELQGVLLVRREGAKRLVVATLSRVGRSEWLVVLHERRSLFTSLSSRVVSVLSDDFLCRVEKLSLLGLLRERLLLHE